MKHPSELFVTVLDHGFVRYIDHMGTDTRIVEAARVSYRSPSKGEVQDKKLLHYLLQNKHTSPFEQCQITFNIKMPIFVMRQFIRHRMQSVNEVSARYTELPCEFYIPKAWRPQDPKNKQGSVETADWNPIVSENEAFKYNAGEVLSFHCRHAYDQYQQMLKAGIAREMARMILPVNIYTEIYTTWDLNNLLKFFALRDDPHAQWEHQQFALAMKAITARLFPWTMEAYELYLKPKAS
jgi:thymidylate synthase (FAD)